MEELPPRRTGLSIGRAGKRRAGKPRTQAQRRERHKMPKKRRGKFVKFHYKKTYFLFRPAELERARRRYVDYIKKKGELKPYEANSIIPRRT